VGLLARILVLAFSLLGITAKAQSQKEARIVYDRMMNAMQSVRAASFTLELKERIYGKIDEGVIQVKLETNPLKVYLKSVKPDAGAEVLYVEGSNNNKALINPNAFPYFNISLSPNNPLLRKHHHHTILQMGFAHAYSIMKYYETTEKDRFYSKLKLSEDKNGTYHILAIDNDEFGFINYKVGKGEDLTSISKKFHVNDQMVLELNQGITDFDDVTAGQVITLPNSYAKKIVMYIDKKNMLPVRQITYDLKGLYSDAEFTNLKVNPTFSNTDFSSDNPQYGF
jgi:outer membrane lipoprotein-sorting protein